MGWWTQTVAVWSSRWFTIVRANAVQVAGLGVAIENAMRSPILS